jgi:hydrogenase maturation protease
MSDRTIVVGLGNPVRSDDSVGLRIVEAVRRAGVPANVTLETAGTCGLGILDLIAGHDRLLLVDAIDLGLTPGAIRLLDLADLAEVTPLHTVSSHDADLLAALETGRRLGLDLPDRIEIIAVQIADITTLSEELSSDVQAAVGPAVRAIFELLER